MAILLSPKNVETDISREEWLKWREHGPDGNIEYTIGGSDMGVVVEGSNKWKTLLEFYHEKKLILPNYVKEITPDQHEVFERGHIEEEHILFNILKPQLEKDLPGRNIVIGQDKRMFQCADRDEHGNLLYPYLVMNPDGYAIIDGLLFVVEIKTLTPNDFTAVENWKKGIVPASYDWQCRHYMKTLDASGAIICCRWSIGGKGGGFQYIFIDRDQEMEEYMLSRAESFIHMLKTNTPPTMDDADPTLAFEYYNRFYGLVEKHKEVELPLSFKQYTDRYMVLQDNIDSLKRQIGELEKQKNRVLTELYPYIENGEKARINIDPDHAVFIYAKDNCKQAQVDAAKLKREFPEVYKDCLEISKSKLQKRDPRIYRLCTKKPQPTGNKSFKIKYWERKK